MKARVVLLPALALLTAFSPLAGVSHAAGPVPQVVDPAGDANFLNDQGEGLAPSNSNPTPVGNQAYADVVSVTWAPVKTGKGKKAKVTAFTVTTAFSGPPVPPSGTSVVYRMLSQVSGQASLYLGPVYYSSPTPGTPQSALRDNLSGTTKLTPLALPKIAGNTMTWTVPLSVVPPKVIGTTVKNLYFEVRELESFQGQTIPSAVPSVGGATGLATGVIDTGSSTSAFTIG